MIVFDLDNTLRDVRGGGEFVPADTTKTENWNDWQIWANNNGTPIKENVEFYEECIKASKEVWIVTGSTFGTQSWLFEHGISEPYRIVERSMEDNRTPFDYKTLMIGQLLYDDVDLDLWVDDALDVCDYAESKCVNVQRIKPQPVVTEDKGMKFDGSKPLYNLLPANAIEEMAKVLTFGAQKYSADNWRYVENALERYRAALLRHTFAIQSGELYDQETGLLHSAHAMCCASFIVELQLILENKNDN